MLVLGNDEPSDRTPARVKEKNHHRYRLVLDSGSSSTRSSSSSAGAGDQPGYGCGPHQRNVDGRRRAEVGVGSFSIFKDVMTRAKAGSVLVAWSQVIVSLFEIETKINVCIIRYKYHHIENYHGVERQCLDEGQHETSRSYSSIILDLYL
jgi:hypothetical protein